MGLGVFSDVNQANIKYIIQSGNGDLISPDIAIGSFGIKQIHVAASDGDVEKMKELIANGANVNEQDKLGNTALHIAAMSDKSIVIELLLDNGADPSIENKDGHTAYDVVLDDTEAQRTLSTFSAAEFVASIMDVNLSGINFDGCKDYFVKQFTVKLQDYSGEELTFREIGHVNSLLNSISSPVLTANVLTLDKQEKVDDVAEFVACLVSSELFSIDILQRGDKITFLDQLMKGLQKSGLESSAELRDAVVEVLKAESKSIVLSRNNEIAREDRGISNSESYELECIGNGYDYDADTESEE